MSAGDYVKIHTLRSVNELREHLSQLGIWLPVDDESVLGPDSPLAQPLNWAGRTIGNRWVVQPMEGWDGAEDGSPTDRVERRWLRFATSGAKLLWGCEAVAVRPDGRANPNQLCIRTENVDRFSELRARVVEAHAERFGDASDLVIGLQLTHSGRFSRPEAGQPLKPSILYHHPLLDARFGIPPDYPVMTDAEIGELVGDFVRAACLAHQAGFDFVDIKHCHGYLGHEFLSAHTRPGPFGGSLANRTRFLRDVVLGIREKAPALGIAVRLSAFDIVPFMPDPERSQPGRPGPGIPVSYCECMPYRYGFGVCEDHPTEIDLTEPLELVGMLRDLGITLVNITAGSPYYNPHIQRPALYPPSDAYLPPEDPLVGVARQMYVVRTLKEQCPGLLTVGTAYTYLQEYLPHVAQAAVREGWTDCVGFGRLALSYPELPADLLSGAGLKTKKLCRTFSDCTTAPRNGLPSGCYPLDPDYKRSPEAVRLAEIKKKARS